MHDPQQFRGPWTNIDDFFKVSFLFQRREGFKITTQKTKTHIPRTFAGEVGLFIFQFI